MNERQERFASEYIIDLDRVRAYKVAYPNVKKDETAKAAATRLLSDVNVKEYVEKALKEIEGKKIANAKEVMEYLSSVMRREKNEHIVVTLRDKKGYYKPDETGKVRKITEETERAEVIEIPAKLSDANRAAEMLAKRYDLLKGDGKEESGGVTIVDDIENE